MKNNNIPLENKKPIAEVQYIENENIPTVEEMRNGAKLPKEYVEKLLNPQANFESDLEVYCSVCSKSETYVDLEVACFSCDNGRVSKWRHDKDGCRDSNTEISNKAYIRCKNCYVDRHMSNWNFACSNHRGEYRAITRNAFNKAMAIALTLQDCSQVISDLNIYIVSHPERFNNN